MDADYTNQGIDQLSKIIDLIKNEPNSRRIILNAWNVKGVILILWFFSEKFIYGFFFFLFFAKKKKMF